MDILYLPVVLLGISDNRGWLQLRILAETGMTDDESSDKIAFEYAWGWFSLHAGQRMQAVNFFLIAITFLSGSYVSAVVGSRPGLAIGISALGAFSSFIFYRIERRVRGLIHAAEGALRPLEQNLASRTGIVGIRIVEKVENAPRGSWPYSKVFRALYAAVGCAFALGALYAGFAKLPSMPRNIDLPQISRLVPGIVLLLFAYSVTRLRTAQAVQHPNWLGTFQELARIFLAVLAALAGGLVLIHLSFWG
jgi:hypothetical protein